MKSAHEITDAILKLTLHIRDQHPELSSFIEEMPVTIPDEKNPEITLKNLTAYYETLNVLLAKYIQEHPSSS